MENSKKKQINLFVIGIIFLILIIFSFALFSSEKIRRVIYKSIRRIENVVYYEATIHNPKGDVLPDGIDDTIKSKIKEILK